MIVMKFGGTSVQDAAAINRVAGIVASRQSRGPVVVVSAMARVTDGLLLLARAATERRLSEALALITELRGRHLSVALELLNPAASSATDPFSLESVERSIAEQFAELEGLARSIAMLGELTPRSQDAIVSFGERLSSSLVAAAFRAHGIKSELVDSRSFIITDDHFTSASPRLAETYQRARAALLPIVESGGVPIAQGFIGSTAEGVTTTIGRGGSDYSAALIGAALEAEAIEIWTDVDGLMTADPRVAPDARRIRVISFAEASELSYFGAKVLHPSTVLPAIERRIPVHIFNTNNPSCEGTLIVAEPRPSSNPIKSIAFKRGVTIVNVASTRMLQAHGFLRAIFEVFDRNQTSVDVVTTSEVSVSITLDSDERLEAIKRDLGGIGEVTVEPTKAIVCVVGDNLKFTPGVAARLFRSIEETNINMISQGASEINLTFVIDESEVEPVVRSLHAEFFSEADAAVFD
ncbi:MAG TPA: lysine-sensitive aspartokinase 3 [Blastocatellia bacterium]|nr:lysine-sensitive aspartokinase 3 [Blastocatellia bacterium]